MASRDEPFWLGVTRQHCDQTSLAHAIRELATNAADADPHQDIANVVRVAKAPVGGGLTATIVNKSARALVPDNLLQGPSYKKNQDQFFGGFGCGLKDAMAVFVREDVEMTITTPVWRGTVMERVRPSHNNKLGAKLNEVCVLLSESTDADRERLDSLMSGAAVAIELRDAAGKKLRNAVDICKLGDMAKYSSAPMPLALPESRGFWRLNPACNATAGNARITLRGLYWADIPLPGCADLVFELRQLTNAERNAMGRDRCNFKLHTVIGAAVAAVQHLVANLHALPGPLQEAVKHAAQTPNMHNEIAKALGDLRAPPAAAAPKTKQKKKNNKKKAGQQPPLFQWQGCPECASKVIEIRELRKEVEQLRALVHAPPPPPRSTADFLLPPNSTAGLTTWARRNSLTAGAEAALAELLALLKRTLTQFGFKDPVVTGSTARRTAVRGEVVDVDIAVWVPPSVPAPASTAIFDGSAFDTSAAFVFRPKEGKGVVVHCDLVHKSFRQHPIDVQFFPDRASHQAQLTFIERLTASPSLGDHAALLAVGLKKWARTVLGVVAGGSNGGAQKVPGWVFEMIAVAALDASGEHGRTSAADAQLTPALFSRALGLLQAPPREVYMGCEVAGPAYRAVVAAAKHTAPRYAA